MPDKRILVVDDEASMAQMLSRHLERKGHAALCVSSGEEALAALERESFRLVVMDIVLPGITGFQALERIADRSEVPVILMTGYADENFMKDAMLLGARGFLEKPLDVEKLNSLLDELLPREEDVNPP